MLLPVAVGGEVGAWVVLGRVGGFDRLPSSLRSNPGAGGGRPHIVRSFLYGRNLTGPPARRRCNRGRVTASHLLDPTVREESAGGGAYKCFMPKDVMRVQSDSSSVRKF